MLNGNQYNGYHAPLTADQQQSFQSTDGIFTGLSQYASSSSRSPVYYPPVMTMALPPIVQASSAPMSISQPISQPPAPLDNSISMKGKGKAIDHENGKKDKRREQNRAAQKTFREKRIKHLKLLEEKSNFIDEYTQSCSDIIHKLWADNVRMRRDCGIDAVAFDQWMADSTISIPSTSLRRWFESRQVFPTDSPRPQSAEQLTDTATSEHFSSTGSTLDPDRPAASSPDVSQAIFNENRRETESWLSRQQARQTAVDELITPANPGPQNSADAARQTFDKMYSLYSSNGLYDQNAYFQGVRGMGFA